MSSRVAWWAPFSIAAALTTTWSPFTAWAGADDLARADIVDARHNRSPWRVVFLGWTADGSAALRTTACGWQDGSGYHQCLVTLDVLHRSGVTDHTVLLDHTAPMYECAGEDCHDLIPTDVAIRFLRVDAQAIAALGPLTPMSPTPAAALLGGDVTLSTRAAPIDGDDFEKGMFVDVVASREGRRARVARKANRAAHRIEGGISLTTWPSPDGAAAVVALRYRIGFNCWGGFTETDLHLVDVAKVRAAVGTP